ncbi:diguanylate cyclase (GGDEF)-like protein [Novosphingobium hassiacum]|uniref:Diguanylate cyclase (GGDEF)-like protein n=1 Tax=Novosphingobium hassiacum TaxID=173676 RepID=A0A7W5ZX43_9SPHN|nr:EAL domain-containing protein [Novosphingobium hassiacum]MBB3861533.1 diguanylate cyclase (GGDEF)-like protein [Novosphingobium hassiacum]
MRRLTELLRLDTSDIELVRAQFVSFVQQMPLLYAILVCNALAIAVEFFAADKPFKTVITPVFICAVATSRAVWWWRQDGRVLRNDAELARLLHRTCNLAVVLTLAFEMWCMWLFEDGDAYAKGHLTFFLALTQVSTVFCLMTLRAAAMRVALVSTVSFAAYFSWVDNGQMLVEAVVLCGAGMGMAVVTHRFNLAFAELVRSQGALRKRQAETEKLSEENRRIAFTDPLSGLPNRRELLVRLDRLQTLRRREPDTLAVIFIDLDGFKVINDEHGHQAGDVLIRSLSARLGNFFPPYASLARVGGDEFAIIVEAEAATAKAIALARAAMEEICLPVLIDRHVLQVGASIGVAANIDDATQPHELLRRADTAMYHVKTQGKGEIAVYDADFDQGRLRRLAIEAQIGKGLNRSEFEVFYQPVVDADTGRMVSVEALIRWPGRPEGALMPDQFIEIAEATGQIHPLGLFVLERACRDLAPLIDIKLSVNVSPAQFRDPAFERQVAHVLDQTRFPPARLQFEITEGYLLAHPERAIRAVEAFKATGMSVALDDFGTGFTSIHYLRSYGFSHIKIDKSLLVGLSPGSKATMLVTGAISLACGLDMRVIAEGVETETQAELLRAAGCHELQGYLFGRPMPIADLIALCREQFATEPGQRDHRLAG